MKAKYYFIILLAGILLWNCKGEEKSGVWDETIEKSTEFPEVKTLSSGSIDLDAVITIENWFIDDSLLACSSPMTKTHFYRFNLNNWSLHDSLGTHGNGPQEFIRPFLIYKAPGEYLALDNSTKKICLIQSDSIKEGPQVPTKLYNHPKLLSNDRLGYIDYLRDRTSWLVQSLENGDIVDSLCLVNEDNKRDTHENDFLWDASSNHVVLSFMRKNQFAIGSRDSDGKITWKLYYTEAPTASKRKYYYSGIACAENCFYILSLKNIDLEAGAGHSEIEVYDYDGKPLQLLKLDIDAWSILLDSSRNRFLLQSLTSDSIYSVSLN